LSDRRPWYVLRCAPQSELQAEKQIKQLGYDAMAPYEQGKRRVRGNNRLWKWPLFPGYLFASWENWHEGWNRITGKLLNKDGTPNEADRIASIYGFLHPIWVPMPYLLIPSDVEHLRSISDGKFKRDEQEAPRLKVGDQTLISDGPFEGKIGTLSEVRGKRATVSVQGEKNVLDVEIEVVKLEKV
jgi:transcription antitermination factor NusG